MFFRGQTSGTPFRINSKRYYYKSTKTDFITRRRINPNAKVVEKKDLLVFFLKNNLCQTPLLQCKYCSVTLDRNSHSGVSGNRNSAFLRRKATRKSVLPIRFSFFGHSQRSIPANIVFRKLRAIPGLKFVWVYRRWRSGSVGMVVYHSLLLCH